MGRAAQGKAGRRQAGFTLIELLVVLAIIMILSSIAVPAIMSSMRSGRETTCKNNLHQIGVALTAYMGNWDRFYIPSRPPDPKVRILNSAGGIVSPVYYRVGFDNLSPLYGVPGARTERTAAGTFEYKAIVTERYVPDIRVFNCPSTRDPVGTLDDPTEWYRELLFKRTASTKSVLTYTWESSAYTVATSDPPTKPKMDYEYCGEFWPSTQYTGINNNRAWLVHDEDANCENTQAVLTNGDYTGLKLTSKANHGTRGGNMLFIDGRVEWINELNWIDRVMGGIREWGRITNWTLPAELQALSPPIP